MSVARTTTQALRTRVAPTAAARSSLRTRGGYRFNSTQSGGPNVNAGAHPAVTGAAAGAAAALLVGYGAYKYSVSFGAGLGGYDLHLRFPLTFRILFFNLPTRPSIGNRQGRRDVHHHEIILQLGH
jgi:hypothetical protein